MSDLFQTESPAPSEPAESGPRADRLRPRALAEVVGQDHLTGPEGAIGRMVAAGMHGRKTGRGFYDYASDPPAPGPRS